MDDIIPAIDPSNCVKTYTKVKTPSESPDITEPSPSEKGEPLTTIKAAKFLLEGNLSCKVCRYCLNIVPKLSELDQILQVANKDIFYKVTIRTMIASFYPFKVVDQPNFPDKICEKCLDRAIACYLFTQQCEQTERALRNCFDDIYDKMDKLDPLERTKKRGRQKLNPNYNTLQAEYEKVIDYADPIIQIVNTAAETLTEEDPIDDLECLKCSELLPNVESLLNHTKIHPKSMWYNCRLCGKSFPKVHLLRKHFRTAHSSKAQQRSSTEVNKFECKTCGLTLEKYQEYLQHIEKHKFKVVVEHLLEKKMDKLCSVCFNKENNMLPLDGTVCLHGGCPELSGDRSLHTILASALPEMNILENYTGTKICEKCLNHAITSYIFVNQTYFVRRRLATCVSVMLDKLNVMIDPSRNICIEIALSAIMNIIEPYNDIFDNEDEKKIEVLEDEFRMESEDESESEAESKEALENTSNTSSDNEEMQIKNTPINGIKIENSICSEFLTFKKKPKPKKPKFICPICSKHFVSDYFIKRHVLKHVPRNIECNICSLKFKSKFDMYEHKKMTHIFSKSYYLSCKVCGRCYTNEVKLKNHIKNHKNKSCQFCDKKFKNQRCYDNHMRRHVYKLGIIMKKYSQSCSFCEKDCPNDNEFSLHVNKVHLQMKPYSCDMCERYFYTEYNLKSHKRVHDSRSKEQCNFCNKILSSRKKLVIHIRKHIGDMPFFCQICKQSFYSQFSLGKHMKTHHGGMFCCKICRTVHTTKKELTRHANKVHNSLF